MPRRSPSRKSPPVCCRYLTGTCRLFLVRCTTFRQPSPVSVIQQYALPGTTSRSTLPFLLYAPYPLRPTSLSLATATASASDLFPPSSPFRLPDDAIVIPPILLFRRSIVPSLVLFLTIHRSINRCYRQATPEWPSPSCSSTSRPWPREACTPRGRGARGSD